MGVWCETLLPRFRLLTAFHLITGKVRNETPESMPSATLFLSVVCGGKPLVSRFHLSIGCVINEINEMAGRRVCPNRTAQFLMPSSIPEASWAPEACAVPRRGEYSRSPR